MFKQGYLKTIAVFLVPLIYSALLGFLYNSGNHMLQNGDPDLGYLFNSILILDGFPVNHIDHPGTLLQLMGALVIWGFKIVLHEKNSLSVLFHNIRPIYLTTTVLNACFFIYSCLGFGLYALKKNTPVTAILGIQLLPFVFPDFVPLFLRISPEIQILALSFWLVALFLSLNDSRNGMKYWIFLGLFLGAMDTLKATVWPTMALVLRAFTAEKKDRWKKALVSSSVMLSTFAVITIPAWHNMGRMFQWMASLFFHSGIYGTGKPTVIDPESFSRGWQELTNATGFTFFAVFLFTSVLVFVALEGKKNSLDTLVQILPALFLGFLVLKHPASRYLCGFAPILLILNLRIGLRIPAPLYLLCVLFFFSFGYRELQQQAVNVHNALIAFSEASAAADDLYDRKYARCAVTVIHPASWKAFGFFSGNNATAGYEYGKELRARYFPRAVFLAQEQNWVRTYDRIYTYPEFEIFLNEYPCQVFSGSAAVKDWLIKEFGLVTKEVHADAGRADTFFFLHEGPVRFVFAKGTKEKAPN